MKVRKKTKADPVDPVAGGDLPPPKRRALSLPKGWQRGSEALDKIEVVSTIFPDFNRATRCGGLPVNRMHTIHGPTHGGKAVPSHTLVCTPYGWREIGELQVGDAVTGKNGNPYRVTGVFPQGFRPVFKATFSDGTSATCCDEHLWHTTTKNEWFAGAYTRGPRPERVRILTGKHGEGSVKTFAEIRRTLAASHELPLVAPVQYQPWGVPVPLDPYVLGLLLGDGCIVGASPVFHKPEPDLWDALGAHLPIGDVIVPRDEMSVGIRGGGTMGLLRQFGLHGKHSWEKFIPPLYMRTTPRERMQLLRGLCDTDGYVVRDGERVEYTTTSAVLADQVVELARGLGAYVTCSWRTTQYSHGGEKLDGRPSARINIWFEDAVPVSSKKHLAKWTAGRVDKQRIRKTIDAVEPAGEEDCVCISVDAPDQLYVLDDFVVTHNTAFVFGLLRSFLDGEHAAAYVDAEHSTPQEFAAELLGELQERDNFFARSPDTYEDTIDAVNDFLKMMTEERKHNPERRSIVVVDSINKLTPKRELTNVLKSGGEEVAKGHAGRYRAAVNQAWLNHLSPRLKPAGCAMVFIAQERDDGNGELWEADGGVEIKGGQALSFDASMLIRVSKAAPVRDPSTASDKSKGDIVGFVHRVRIYKSKVSHMDGAWTDCQFALSNGKQTPAGFDTARDAMHVAKKLGVVQVNGSWLSWSKRRWQGEPKGVAWLAENPTSLNMMLAEIDVALREGSRK